MTVGAVIRPSASVLQPLALQNRLGPRQAIAQALAAYLLGLEFRVFGGEARDTVFTLREVLDHWPTPEEDLAYPCASVVEATSTAHLAHSLSPTPLEETAGLFDSMVGWSGAPARTVLWKEGGAEVELQVDFWCDCEADRQAIEAALPAAFSPDEGRSGVVVEGPALYFDRPVGLTLLATRCDDSAVSAGRGERRLRAVVQGACDIVSLRLATWTATPQTLVEIVDPIDPPEEDEP